MNPLKKTLYSVFALTIAVLLLNACGSNSADTSDGKVNVVVSFYPHQFLVESIGKNFVSVQSIITPGIEPHDFEPTPRDLERISHAQLFVYHGTGFDPWAERFIQASSNPPPSLNLSEGFNLFNSGSESETPGQKDPHFWLDPTLMQKAAEKIENKLIEVDPVHKSEYEKNFNELSDSLNALHKNFDTVLANCTNNTVVASHDAYEYLGNRYHFHVEAISGLSPEDEPSINDIKRLVDLLRIKKIHYVLAESLASSRFVQTIADEVGAEVLVLNPIEGLTTEQVQAGENYLTQMQKNLEVLNKALDCHS